MKSCCDSGTVITAGPDVGDDSTSVESKEEPAGAGVVEGASSTVLSGCDSLVDGFSSDLDSTSG